MLEPNFGTSLAGCVDAERNSKWRTSCTHRKKPKSNCTFFLSLSWMAAQLYLRGKGVGWMEMACCSQSDYAFLNRNTSCTNTQGKHTQAGRFHCSVWTANKPLWNWTRLQTSVIWHRQDSLSDLCPALCIVYWLGLAYRSVVGILSVAEGVEGKKKELLASLVLVWKKNKLLCHLNLLLLWNACC